MNRLLLVRHGSTPATRRAAFPADEALDGPGLRGARALGRVLAGADRVLIAPSVSARQTAEAAGLQGQVEPLLAGLDAGGWTGSALDQLERTDPAGLLAWRHDPDARPHGGESLTELVGRARAFLARAQTWPGRTVAIADGAIVKAAVVAALAAPVELFWSIDVSPASITELHGSLDGERARWRLVRSNWTPRPLPRHAGATGVM